LWVVPVATGFIGRLADILPRAKLLGAGVAMWALSTLLTGLAKDFGQARKMAG
jgi:MFS family permease